MMQTITPPLLWQPPSLDGNDKILQEKEDNLVNQLHHIARHHCCPRFASSLAAEDMVLTDAILRLSPAIVRQNITIFSLETGRLPKETLVMINKVKTHYNYDILLYYPEPDEVNRYINEHGVNAFYERVEWRKLCCRIRKVAPLNRALEGADAWLTGQRREQAVTRQDLSFSEYDEMRNMPKYNPLADWYEHDIWAYLEKHHVPVNDLHYQGYPSIGCEPCSCAVKAGEDIRSGRWWWESHDSKECGLHTSEKQK